MYLYVNGVGHFAQKYVGTYFHFRWILGSAVDGQVGEWIPHVLIVYVKEMFLLSLGMKEVMGKDADLRLVPLVGKQYVDVCVERDGTCIGTFLKGIL